MMRASIDIGSNSVLLLIAEIDDEGALKEVANESRVTGLGRGLAKNNKLSQEAMKETYLALKEYVLIATEMGISAQDIIVTATEASRVALNAEEFFERVIGKLGIQVKVISGAGEAYYTALGVCKMAKATGEVTIVDIGGASAEIMKVRCKPFKVIASVSLAMGSVRATDWIKGERLMSEMKMAWAGSGADKLASPKAIFVAGTMTSLAAMILGMTSYEGDKIGNEDISFEKLKKFIRSVATVDGQSLQLQYPFLGKRAASIVGGAEVAIFLGDKLKLEQLQISPYGLRYGTIIEGSLEDRYVQRHFK